MIRLLVLTTILLMSLFGESYSAEHCHKLSFMSELMGHERMFNVHLPADYSQASQKRYPVVYQLQSDDTFLAAASASLGNRQPDGIGTNAAGYPGGH